MDSDSDDCLDILKRIDALSRTKKKSPRIAINTHNSLPKEIFDGIQDSIKHIRSIDIVSSEFHPENTITIAFHGIPVKPIVLVEPPFLDEQFVQSIDPRSIIITKQYENIKLKSLCAFYSIILLKYHKESISIAIQQILVQNNIIGEGSSIQISGDLWKELLQCIPQISTSISQTLCSVSQNREELLKYFEESMKNEGNKIPSRSLANLISFFNSNDPHTLLLCSTKKR